MPRPTPPSVHRPRATRAGALILTLALALLFGACGGDDPTFNDLLEASAESGDPGGSDLLDDFSIGGIRVESDGDENITTTFGSASTGIGTDLGRPDWLEPWIQLPEGLTINLAIDDPGTGEREIHGIVSGADEATIKAQQRAMLEAQGYEALQESGYFVAPGRPTLQIEVYDLGDGTTGYIYSHSFDDEQTLRDLYAAVDGRGTLTAWIDGKVLSFDGTCTLRSASGQFASDDGQANLTVEERDGEQDYILGNVIDADSDNFESWSILQVTDAGQYPALSIRRDGFQVDGFVVDTTFSNPTGATIEVKCPS